MSVIFLALLAVLALFALLVSVGAVLLVLWLVHRSSGAPLTTPARASEPRA